MFEHIVTIQSTDARPAIDEHVQWKTGCSIGVFGPYPFGIGVDVR